MSRIKSAWEIALERTQDIEVDKDRLAKEEMTRRARALAGSYLNYDEGVDEESVAKDWEGIRDKEGAREGLRMALLQNLTLPGESVLNDRYERLSFLAGLLSGGNGDVAALMGQITAFLKQYPEHQQQLLEQLKAHFRPMLEEKEAKLSEQYGQPVHIAPESDKDFMKLAQQQLEALRKQYSDSLDQAKAQLERLI